MKGVVLISGLEKKCRELAHAPCDREQLALLFPGPWSQPLYIEGTGQTVPAVDDAGYPVDDADLVLAHGWQPVNIEHEEQFFTVGNHAFCSIGLIAAQKADDKVRGALPSTLSTPTKLLRLADAEAVSQLVNFSPNRDPVDETGNTGTHVNVPMCDAYLKMMCDAVEKQPEDGMIRLIVKDRHGNMCGQNNFSYMFFNEMRRFAYDHFDAHQVVYCDWVLHERTLVSDTSEGRPIGALASPVSEDKKPDFSLCTPDGEQGFKFNTSLIPWKKNMKVQWYPLPGLSIFSNEVAPIMVTWVKKCA